MSMINHPRILKLYEVFIQNETMFLVTKFCNGGTLEETILNDFPNGMGETKSIEYLR